MERDRAHGACTRAQGQCAKGAWRWAVHTSLLVRAHGTLRPLHSTFPVALSPSRPIAPVAPVAPVALSPSRSSCSSARCPSRFSGPGICVPIRRSPASPPATSPYCSPARPHPQPRPTPPHPIVSRPRPRSIVLPAPGIAADRMHQSRALNTSLRSPSPCGHSARTVQSAPTTPAPGFRPRAANPPPKSARARPTPCHWHLLAAMFVTEKHGRESSGRLWRCERAGPVDGRRGGLCLRPRAQGAR